ncbi:plasmid replication/partition related protein [Rhodoferax mekongensis]|uniref:Plasmid replication/partition related protein n=1 Tax=Rhodoferax mekongensis TaxID=3068341 RepID=A0ABZ0B216_9BURK|nr:plasmid replication/partition related protein [Rhodoferax sp. TBRC 17307]WNO05740.1 plasmid replication/partition related protein [Rhodoferax sp. TBRC 17307]
MDIIVNEELKAYIDPLTPEEHAALERSILNEGCRDALVLWGDVLVDGHNRYGICRKHGLPFNTVQSALFKSMDDVHLWMIDQHLGRRSVSDFQRGVLALRKREILAARQQLALVDALSAEPAPQATSESTVTSTPITDAPVAPAFKSREDLAKAARLSSSQVVMIEKIQKQAAPELVAAVKSGVISINAAAAVATLPAEEQVAAASAGKEELKLAAKRVRDAKRAAREAMAEHSVPAFAPDDAATEGIDPLATVAALQQRVAALEAENAELRQQLQALRNP